MNCANHPETPVAAFCQNCGKPLCSQCVRSISGVIYCENCLAAKLGIGGVPAGSTPAGFVAPGIASPGFQRIGGCGAGGNAFGNSTNPPT